MRRALVGLVLTASLFVVTVSSGATVQGRAAGSLTNAPLASARPAAHSVGCHRYSVAVATHTARKVYAGTRHVSAHDLALLSRVAHCLRNPHAFGYVAWYIRHQRALWKQRCDPFTGYAVSGTVSTFGPPAEGGSQTADGGNDSRPCIALRDPSTLGRMFRVSIAGHTADLLHCDSGPYAGGRSIDVTGNGAYRMGLNPFDFPTDAWGVARELKR